MMGSRKQKFYSCLTCKWCLILAFITLLPSTYSDNFTTNDVESKLMRHLFQHYNKLVRPVRNKLEPVTMKFGIAYVQLIQLDDRAQTLISNVWVRQKWNNSYLKWNPEDFNNITKLNVDPKKVWVPDIVLHNNAKNALGAGTMYQFKTKVELRYDGESAWYAPTILRSSCNIDITFFPFDDQYCILKFGSWGYNGLEIDLLPNSESADLKPYLPSAEFHLKSALAKSKIDYYKCCVEPYPTIIFTIHLRRQPGFFLFNVIIPSMVITFFAILTFSSPPPIGERISLAIESFLALSFLCMMVADSMPVNSDVSPLITKFLIMCMILISAALFFNLVPMNLTDGNKEVPFWLKTITLKYIGPLLGFFPNKDLGKTKLYRKITSHFPPYEFISKVSNKMEEALTKDLDHIESNGYRLTHKKIEFKNMIPNGLTKGEYQNVVDNMNDIVARSTSEMKQYLNKDFWRCFAQTIDRMFMLLFGISFVFVSAIMLLKGYGHQLSVQKGH